MQRLRTTLRCFLWKKCTLQETKTIDEVADFLGLDKKQTIKALLFVTYDNDGNENGYVAAFVRGDRELNMTKLVNALDIPEHAIEFADEEKMSAATGCVGGFTGPAAASRLQDRCGQ